jgi:hypothetical protein
VTVLLVTGSRALTAYPWSVEWAVAQLRAEITGTGRQPPDRVVTGDALGPDTWAADTATAAGVLVTRWTLGGEVQQREPGRLGRWYMREHWCPPHEVPPVGQRGAWRSQCLRRDREMVLAVGGGRYGTPARVLALVAPWSRTRGTAYTARLAREAGLPVDWRAAPAFAPAVTP